MQAVNMAVIIQIYEMNKLHMHMNNRVQSSWCKMKYIELKLPIMELLYSNIYISFISLNTKAAISD